MKKELYYVKQTKRVNGKTCRFRVGAVTVIKDNKGKFHRGISILSLDDNFNRKTAVETSNARALQAMGTGLTSLPIKVKDRLSRKGKKAVIRFLAAAKKDVKTDMTLFFKSTNNAYLTKFEQKLFAVQK